MKQTLADAVVEFLDDQSGASATEYAIVVSVIAAAVLVATKLFDIRDAYNAVTAKVSNCVNGSC